MMTKIQKRHLIGLSLIICHSAFSMMFTSCDKDDSSPSVIAPTSSGTMQDLDGNTYRWVRIDTLDWMAENLHAGTPWYNQSRFDADKNDEEIYPFFGNYYNYAEALAQCPEGWRLPTDDDWKSLERACGMSAANADRTGWRSGSARAMTNPEHVNLLFAGELSAYNTIYIQLYHSYDYGIYWTATLDSSLTDRSAYIRKITPALNEVQRVSTPINTHWFSVRYVRTAK